MAVIKALLVILACVFGLLFIIACLLIFPRYKFYLYIAVDGLRVDVKPAVGIGKKKLISYSACVYYKDGWHYELRGPFEELIRQKIDETLKKPKEEAEAAAQMPQKPEKPPNKLVQRFLEELIKSVHIERWRVRALIGIADDAMATAMTAGYVMIFVNTLSAILVSHFTNDNALDISVQPVFNKNKLSITLDCVLTLRLMDALKKLLRRI